MKALILLFLAVCFFFVGWNYSTPRVRKTFSTIVRTNLLAIVVAFLAVAVAVFFSINTTLRLV